MASNYEELPEEIWEQILKGLNEHHHSHFESISLVSKRFLSLTDRLRHRFTVVDQMYSIHGTISPFIYRFKNLRTLDLSRLKHGYVEAVLFEVARSSVALNLEILDISNHDVVPIESLKVLGLSNRKIKVLKCANIVRLRDEDLKNIVDFYPDLEELDISSPRHKFIIEAFHNYSINELMITDAGIEVLSSRLKNLVKIDISMNHLLTDLSLSYLSLNCLRLQEIAFTNCTMITVRGVRFLLDNSPNIRAISMSIISQLHGTSSLFVNPATSGKGLRSIHLKGSDISDEFLDAIVDACIPLKSLSLSGCAGYTLYGISSLLHAYQTLEFLDLSKTKCLCDTSIIHLSQYLRDLVSVKLNFCHELTSTALLTLINNCSFLEHIEMQYTDVGAEEDLLMDNFMKHPNSKIKSLNLAGNAFLTDDCLVKITSICPNLKQLDVSSCWVTTGAIVKVLKNCPKISHLSIQACKEVKNIGLFAEPLKLKKLYMARSGVNDEGLLGIGTRCTELVKIDLSGCLHVTTAAVKYMVTNCKKLREVDMMGCRNVHVFIVDWMVFTRPSLRKLIPPAYAATTESQREILLRHGCQVCDK